MFIDTGRIFENLPNMEDSFNLVTVFSQKPFRASARIRYPTNVSPSTHGIILVPPKKPEYCHSVWLNYSYPTIY